MGAEAPIPSAQPRARILVADADPETRKLYAFAFGLIGCEVVEASDGRQALITALMQPPALVVTELTLPLLDGCALCDILRRDRETTDVPILVVTGDSRPESVERARQTGADSVLVKPAAPEAIVAEARRLLAASHEPHAAAAINAYLIAPRRTPEELTARAARHRTQTRSLERFSSNTPPARPPELRCPSCDGELTYELSHVGGVNKLHREQWDYFLCSAGCGTFQYRQRTRRVRRVE